MIGRGSRRSSGSGRRRDLETGDIAFTREVQDARGRIRRCCVPMPTGDSPLRGTSRGARSVRAAGKNPCGRVFYAPRMATITPADTYALSDDHTCLPRHDPPDRARARARGRPRSTPKRNTPGSCAGCSPSRPARAPVEGGARLHGTGTLMLNIAVEEGLEGLRLDRADPDGEQELGTLPIRCSAPTSSSSASLPKCASGEWSPASRCPSPSRLRPRRHDHDRAPRGRRMGRQRHKNWITTSASPTSTSSSRSQAAEGPTLGSTFGRHCLGTREQRETRSLSAFVVEADRPGSASASSSNKLGIKGSPTGQPIFDDVRIRTRTWSARGQGLSVALARSTPHARVAARRSDRAGPPTTPPPTPASARVRPADQRVPGDPVQARRHGDAHRRRPRAALQGVREDRPSRALPRQVLGGMAKLFASDTAMAVTVEAVQVLGGYG